MERRGTDAIIPPQRQGKKGKTIPLQQFKYDAMHDRVRCPAGKILRRTSSRSPTGGRFHRARVSNCAQCRLRTQCLSPTAQAQSILIVDDYPALLRARRRIKRRDDRWRRLYSSHRAKVEGIHGESKTQHGLHRAVRRRRWNVSIQSYLTAAVINLKRLAKAIDSAGRGVLRLFRRLHDARASHDTLDRRIQPIAFS